MPKPLSYTEKYVTELLTKMNETLKAEEKTGKIKIMFLNDLFLNAGINPHNWVVNIHNKYKNESWYKELYSEIKERMHSRLYRMAIQNPKLTTLVIWLDKCNYGTKEPANTGEEINVTLDVKELE